MGVCHSLPQEGGKVFSKKMKENFKLQSHSLLEDLDTFAWQGNMGWYGQSRGFLEGGKSN